MLIHFEPKWKPVTITLENRNEFMALLDFIENDNDDGGLLVYDLCREMRRAKIAIEK